jgi:hypothetical protein
MMQTAKFVRESGGHSELVLRVRQASNPNFAFLRPDDHRHPYFQWLVTADPQVIPPFHGFLSKASLIPNRIDDARDIHKSEPGLLDGLVAGIRRFFVQSLSIASMLRASRRGVRHWLTLFLKSFQEGQDGKVMHVPAGDSPGQRGREAKCSCCPREQHT